MSGKWQENQGPCYACEKEQGNEILLIMLRTDIDLLGQAVIFFIVTKYKQWETIWEWCISCTVWSYLFTSEVSIPPPKLHNPLYSISNCSLNTPIPSWTIPFYLSLPLPNTTFAPGYPMNSPDILSSLLVTQVLFGLPFYIRSPPQPTSPSSPFPAGVFSPT